MPNGIVGNGFRHKDKESKKCLVIITHLSVPNRLFSQIHSRQFRSESSCYRQLKSKILECLYEQDDVFWSEMQKQQQQNSLARRQRRNTITDSASEIRNSI